MRTLIVMTLCFCLLGTARQGLRQSASASVGALFTVADNKEKFSCSGFVVGKQVANYIFLTAAHCIEDSLTHPELSYLVTFSANEGEPRYKATPLAISQADDLAVVLVTAPTGIQVEVIGDEAKLAPGAEVLNVSYIYSYGRVALLGRFVEPRYPHMPPALLEFAPLWTNAMPVDIVTGGGASGSPLFDEKQSAVIGMIVGRDGVLSIAIPASRIKAFMATLKVSSVRRHK